VPRKIGADVRSYLFRRSALMKTIEQKDIEQMKDNPPAHP
jgi:hypothetical protein